MYPWQKMKLKLHLPVDWHPHHSQILGFWKYFLKWIPENETKSKNIGSQRAESFWPALDLEEAA